MANWICTYKQSVLSDLNSIQMFIILQTAYDAVCIQGNTVFVFLISHSDNFDGYFRSDKGGQTSLPRGSTHTEAYDVVSVAVGAVSKLC